MKRCFAIIVAVFVLAAPLPTRAEVTVFAAASLKNALEDATKGQQVVFSFAGSGTIARQIAVGAPADLVILAHTNWMDWLAEQGALMPGTRRDLLGNRLVVVGPAGAAPLAEPVADDLMRRLGTDRLALGEPASVPAGIYARDWLEHIGVWGVLGPHLAPTDNVRAALALVARGETPLGLVYATDAAADPRVQVVYQVPQDQHATILYPAAAITPGGFDLLTFLQSPAARIILAAHGFIPLETSE